MKLKIMGFSLASILSLLIFLSYSMLGERMQPLIYLQTLQNNLVETGVRNIVMTVYLNYRLFDTLFEAMLLLICVMGVVQFSQFSAKENKFIDNNRRLSEEQKFSPLMIDSLKTVYPFVLLFGVYVIISGINSFGGGFQGGAIVAAVVMSLHLSTGRSLIGTERAIVIEKIMFALLLTLAALFFMFGSNLNGMGYKIFLVILNIIIGFKVFSGFVVLYMQFMSIGRRAER